MAFVVLSVLVQVDQRRMCEMRCRLFLLELVVFLSLHHSHPAAATDAGASPLAAAKTLSRWCTTASMRDLIDNSEACRTAQQSLVSDVECRASVDSLLQLCLNEAAGGSQQTPTDDPLGALLLKRGRNRFLGKRLSGSRNNFLGKRQLIGASAAEDDEKRSRNRFLGKRIAHDSYDGFYPTSVEKRSRNRFLGKRDELEDLIAFGNSENDKRSRNRFLGKRDQESVKRSRVKFLGKRDQDEEHE